MDVQQLGAVTPNHLAKWITDGVIADGGAVLASTKVLASIKSADFNSTGDQLLLFPPSVTAFQLTGIVVANASLSLTTAVGGVYTSTSKNGSVVVAASQVYSSLTSANLLLQLTLAAFAQTARFSTNNLPTVVGSDNLSALAMYFALTTAQGAAATADIYAIGLDLTLT